MKIRVGVFFGGKSVEHEVSVISAMQAIAALDQQKYQAVPIYITKENQFYTGEHLGQIESYQDIPGALKRAARITLIGGQNTAVLQCYPPKKLGSSQIGEIDVILPVTHGTNVEDGALQGFFEYLNIPYAGCDVCASAAGMDKWVMKSLFKSAGLVYRRQGCAVFFQFFISCMKHCRLKLHIFTFFCKILDNVSQMPLHLLHQKLQ